MPEKLRDNWIRQAWLRQLFALVVLLAIWEAIGRAGMLNPLYLPTPSRIGAALFELFAYGRISRRRSRPRSAVSRSALRSVSCSVSPPRWCRFSPSSLSR